MRSYQERKEQMMEQPEQQRVDEEEQAPPQPPPKAAKESQPQQQGGEPQRDTTARKYALYLLLFIVIAAGIVLGLYFGGVFERKEEEIVENFGKSRFDTEPPSESPTSSPTPKATYSPTLTPRPSVMPVPVTLSPTAEGDVYCSDARCGFSYNDALTKCGASCLVWDDVACGEGENCFYGLTKDLDCCITVRPTSDPTQAPSSFGDTPAPTRQPGTCGRGNVGNGICPIFTECCSEYGWCGATEEFCTSEAAASLPCGNGNVGTGICELPGDCCSEFGFCGTTEEFCSTSPPVTTTESPSLRPTTSPSSSPSIADTLSPTTSPTTSSPTITPASNVTSPTLPPTSSPTIIPASNVTSPTLPPTSSPTITPASNVTSPTLPPTSSPTAITLPVDDTHSRLIAYQGNWHSCPTRDQWQYYTHIVISFAVSYAWGENKNICSETCEIATPPVCENAPNPELIQEWKDAGKKVLLSFGGAGMGGSWFGDVNNCWDYCFGRETQVVDRLVEIVAEMGLDGVDLDYEYFVEPNPNNPDFNLTSEAETFLADVTTGLRESLPEGAIVTHAPLDNELVQGTAYYNILKAHASSLDFLMPQYYNGITHPLTDFMGTTLGHYTDLVEDMFGGDPTKIVFGFCIEDCSATSSNVNGFQAALVMNLLQVTHPCNGGAFFWVAEHDYGGEWSRSITQAIMQNDCSV